MYTSKVMQNQLCVVSPAFAFLYMPLQIHTINVIIVSFSSMFGVYYIE